MSNPPRLPDTFGRLAWSNLAAQSAEQIALAAAPIAKASPDAIGWQATRIALAGFLIPFMSVFEPALMLQQGGALTASQGYWIEVAWVLFKAFVVVGMTGVAAIGFLFIRTSIAERVLAGVAAGLLISPLPWTDQGGLLLAAAIAIVNWSRARPASERA